MKLKDIESTIQILDRDLTIFKNTLSQLLTLDRQQEYKELIAKTKGKIEAYKDVLTTKSEKKAKKILSKAKDKEPKEDIDPEFEAVKEQAREAIDAASESWMQFCRDHAKDVNKEIFKKIKDQFPYVDQTEKIIQPSDNKTEPFDLELNDKFAIFNGWEIVNKGHFMCAYTKREVQTSYYVTRSEAKERLNYLEDPKLIQETIDNINTKGHGQLLCRAIPQNIFVLETWIDCIYKRESEKTDLEKSYNEGYEAGRKQPKEVDMKESDPEFRLLQEMDWHVKNFNREIEHQKERMFKIARQLDEGKGMSYIPYKYTDYQHFKESNNEKKDHS